MGKQHYVPAGFIGYFGQPLAKDVAARRRRVWVARRGVPRIWRDTAQNVGVSKKKANLYDSHELEGLSLDPTLTKSEGVLGYLEGFCGQVIQQGVIDANLFVTGIAPFVAGLLIRHPSLAIPAWSELGMTDKRSSSQDVFDRWGAFWRTADHLIFNTRWTIIDSHFPLVTTDLGYVWLPGEGIGTLHIPIHPFAMLQISAGRSYYLGDQQVWISTEEWPVTTLLQSQLAMMLQANEVFGMDEQGIQIAHDVMHGNGPTEIDGVDVSVLPDTRALAFLAGGFGANHPILAWRRFHLAQTDVFGCRCAEELQVGGLPPESMQQWAANMTMFDEEARVSVPGRDVITPWDLMLGGAYTRRPEQIEGSAQGKHRLLNAS